MSQTKQTNLLVLFIFLNQILWSLTLSFVFALIPSNYAAMLVIPELCIFLLPVLFYLHTTKKSPKTVLRLKGIDLINILLIVLLSFAIQPFMMFFSAVSSLVFPNVVSEVLYEMKELPLPLLLFAVAVTPAILEELLFRGVVLSGYSHLSPMKACLLSGFLFGLAHLSLQQLLYATLGGIFFSYLVHRTDSLFSSILAHFTINASQGLQSYFIFQQDVPLPTELPENMLLPVLGALLFAVITLPIFLGLLWLFTKHNPKKDTPPPAGERVFDKTFLGILIVYGLSVIFF